MFVRIGDGVVVNMDHVIHISYQKAGAPYGFLGRTRFRQNALAVELDNGHTLFFAEGTTPYNELQKWVESLNQIQESVL